MAIPETQLETWSHQGAVNTSSNTYRSIQAAFYADSSSIRNMAYEVYLQGSYKNDTNIRGDSDVDVVVQLNSTFGYDLSGLDEEQKRHFSQSYPSNATYQFEHFRADVLRSLRAYYGQAAVTEGSRALKLAAASGRLTADVIPAIQHRKYRYFFGTNGENHVEGIKLWDRHKLEIVNFPKIHYENGVTKQSPPRTNGWYKPTVRIFKNARTYLIGQGLLEEDLAPSYFLECLLYNVPDLKFGGSYQRTLIEAFNWLWGTARAEALVCQNEQIPLFGNSSDQWNTSRAKQFLNALKDLWETW